jgi:hypothetical protein
VEMAQTASKKKKAGSPARAARAKAVTKSAGSKAGSKTTVPKGTAKSVLRDDCFFILNEDNTVDAKREPKLDKALLLRMYRNMALLRLRRARHDAPAPGPHRLLCPLDGARGDSDWHGRCSHPYRLGISQLSGAGCLHLPGSKPPHDALQSLGRRR